MASINVRIDDDLKARAYRELERLGVTPSELMRPSTARATTQAHSGSGRSWTTRFITSVEVSR